MSVNRVNPTGGQVIHRSLSPTAGSRTLLNPIKMSVWILLIPLVVSLSNNLAAQSIKGAWQIFEASGSTDGEDWVTERVQPSLYLFLDGYYSIMLIRGDEARPLMSDDATIASLTVEEFRSILKPFVANSGTYKVSDGKLKTQPLVAMWPNYMEQGSSEFDYTVDGDVLTLSQTVSWSGKSRTLVIKLKRLE